MVRVKVWWPKNMIFTTKKTSRFQVSLCPPENIFAHQCFLLILHLILGLIFTEFNQSLLWIPLGSSKYYSNFDVLCSENIRLYRWIVVLSLTSDPLILLHIPTSSPKLYRTPSHGTGVCIVSRKCLKYVIIFFKLSFFCKDYVWTGRFYIMKCQVWSAIPCRVRTRFYHLLWSPPILKGHYRSIMRF